MGFRRSNQSLPFLLLAFLVSGGVAASSGLYFHEEKATHLHFYFHDVRTGPNATSVTVAGLHRNSSRFGNIGPLDNPLTEGPDLGSKLVGRAQGLFADVSMDEPAVLTALNFMFTDGEYNGSSLAMFGRAGLSPVTERPIIGGSGQFRLARGYTLSTIIQASPAYILSEFNVYVTHY